MESFFKKGEKGKYTYITNIKREYYSSEIDFIFYGSPKMKWNEVADISKSLILPKEIKEIFMDNHKYILLTGLGGYTGTYLLKELIVLLKEENKDFLALCALPFAFEGFIREQYSEQFKNLFPNLPNLKYFELDTIKEKYGNKSFVEGFEIAADEMYKLFKNEIEKQN